jgi:putative inorganic carbon (hco3(-)) transporter
MKHILQENFSSLKTSLYTLFFNQKLNNPAGLLLFLSLGLLVGTMIPYAGMSSGMVLMGLAIGVPVVVACMFYQQFGIAFTLFVAFFVQYIGKYTSAPIGTSLDGLLLIMIFGVFISQIIKKDWSFAKDPISTLLLIWVFYNILQVLNPAQESKIAWLFTVRSLAILNLLYFIACHAFSSLHRIKWMLHFIIILATFTALYGLKQEFFGYSAAEKAWIYTDSERFQLFFQWGRMRTFSLFNDAMTFGVMMAYMGVFCLVYATAPISKSGRWALFTAAMLMFWSASYTGTRTSFVLMPIGVLFFAAMTLKRSVLIVAGIFTVIGTGLVLKSTSNAVIYRIQSAFKPSEDASVQIRYNNQKRIRPHIYAHPIGSGPGSTGLWARRFTPNSFLAKFAHDSYYVRLAVEEGWIGLILYMAFLFVVLRRALYFYLRTKEPQIKTLYLALLTSLFMLAVANYPQEAIVQLPTSLVVYVFFAAIVRLKDFDPYYQSIVKKDTPSVESISN